VSNPNNAPQPGPTDPDIFQNGIGVWLVSGPRSMTIEEWVQGLAKTTGLRMDWRQIGGRGVVLVLGDRAACERAQKACADATDALRDLYMACPFNWTSTPERRDVYGQPLDIEAS
jgi:hypothetical protein